MGRLDRIEARLAAASSGEWGIAREESGTRRKNYTTIIWAPKNVVCRIGPVGVPYVQEDADLIVNAPADLADLLRVARLVQRIHLNEDRTQGAYEATRMRGAGFASNADLYVELSVQIERDRQELRDLLRAIDRDHDMHERDS